MHPTLTAQLDELVRLRHTPPATVLAEAVELGLSKLYAETILGRYLRKQVSRRKAIALVGLEAVTLAQRQQQVTQQDLAWGLGRSG